MALSRKGLEQAINHFNAELAKIRGEIDDAIAQINTLNPALAEDTAFKSKFPQGLQGYSDALAVLKNNLKDFTSPVDADFTDQASMNKLDARLKAHAGTVNLEHVKPEYQGITLAITGIAKNYQAVLDAARIIAAYDVAQIAVKTQLDAAKTLADRLAGDDKKVEDYANVAQQLVAFNSAKNELEARKAELDGLAKIKDPADPSDRTKFNDTETTQATTALVTTLVKAQNELEEAIKAAKQAEIEKLREQCKAALEIPNTTFTDRADGTLREAEPVKRLITDLKSQRNDFITRAQELLAATSRPHKDKVTDDSSLMSIKAVEAEITSLTTALQTATDAAARAYDAELAKAVSAADVENQRKAFAAEAQPSIATADKILTDLKNPPVNTIAGINPLNAALQTARNALEENLRTFPAIDDTNKDTYVRDTVNREKLLTDLAKAVDNVNKAILKKCEDIRYAELVKMQPAFDAFIKNGYNFRNSHPDVQGQINPDHIEAAELANTELARIHGILTKPLTPPYDGKALTNLTAQIATLNIDVKISDLTNAVEVIDTNLAAYQLQKDIKDKISEIETRLPDLAIWNKVPAADSTDIDTIYKKLEEYRDQIEFDPAGGLSLLSLDELNELREEFENTIDDLADQLDAAKKAYDAVPSDVDSRKATTASLIDKIDKARAAALTKFNTDYPDVGKYSPTDASLKANVDACKHEDVALINFNDELEFEPGTKNPRVTPLTAVQLTALDAKINAAIAKLDTAVANVKPNYKLAEAKQALKDKVAAAINDPAITAIVDDIRKKYPVKADRDKAFPDLADRMTDLTDLRDTIIDAATDQNELDDCSKQFNAALKARDKAIKDAQLDVQKYRAENVKAQFNRYVERINLIEGVVELIARGEAPSPGKPDKYKDTLAEIERMKVDMELYKLWMDKEKKPKEANDAQKHIDRLDGIIKALKATPTADAGIRHFSKHSIKVDDTDPATKSRTATGDMAQYEKNIKQAKKDILEGTPYAPSSAPAGAGSLTGLSPAVKKMQERTTAGFTKLDTFEGRVNLTETGSSKSLTVSIDVQRIDKSGARVEQIEFLKNKKTGEPLYDNSTQRYSHPSGLLWGVHKFSSDSVNAQAIRHVLKYIFANKSEDLRNTLIDTALKNIIAGVDDPVLRQAAKDQLVHINGRLPDTYAQAVKDFSDFIGVECHDTRDASQPDVHLIRDKDQTKNRGETYRHYIHEKAAVLFKDILPVVQSKTTAAELAEKTTPKPR